MPNAFSIISALLFNEVNDIFINVGELVTLKMEDMPFFKKRGGYMLSADSCFLQ